MTLKPLHPSICIIVAVVALGCDGSVDLPKSPALSGLEIDVVVHLQETYETLQIAARDLTKEELGKAFGDAGMTYHAYDLPLMARKCYLRARQLDRNEPRWLYLLAKIEIHIGNIEVALGYLQQMLNLEPNHLPSLVALGELQLTSNDFQSAKVTFLDVLARQPQCAPALAGLGKIALLEDNPQLALQRLEEALNLSPGASGLRYPYGLALRGLNRDEEALDQMEARGDAFPRVEDLWIEEIRNRPVGARIPLNRGITFFQEGYYDAAEVEFRASVLAAPESASAHLNLGSTLVKLKRPRQAIVEFEESIRLDPGSTMSWFNLGVIHASLGDDLEAIHCYDQALMTEPGMPEALFNRANALRRLKRYQQSAYEMKKVREIRPGNSLAWLAESVCYFRLGKETESLKVCREGRQSTANDPRLVSLEARLLATMSSVTEEVLQDSLVELNQLLEHEKALEYVESKAMLLAAMGKFDQALQWQQAAIEAAKSAGESEIVSRLETNRLFYSRGEPARDPWPESVSVADPAGSADSPPSPSPVEVSPSSEESRETSQ